jgi:hypothetical protein
VAEPRAAKIASTSGSVTASGGCDKRLQAFVQIAEVGDLAHDDGNADDGKKLVVVGGGRKREGGWRAEAGLSTSTEQSANQVARVPP